MLPLGPNWRRLLVCDYEGQWFIPVDSVTACYRILPTVPLVVIYDRFAGHQTSTDWYWRNDSDVLISTPLAVRLLRPREG